MADGVRERAAANVGIGITGIAGPGGRHAGQTGRHGGDCRSHAGGRTVRTFQFIGPRDMVKYQSAQAAMNMLRLLLSDGTPLHGR